MYSELQKHKINPLLNNSLTQLSVEQLLKQFGLLQKIPKYPFPIRGVANTAELTAIRSILQTDPFSKVQMEPKDQTLLQAKAEWQLSPPLAYQLSPQHSPGDRADSRGFVRPWHCMCVGDLHLPFVQVQLKREMSWGRAQEPSFVTEGNLLSWWALQNQPSCHGAQQW